MTATEHNEALKRQEWCEAQSALNVARFYLDDLKAVGKGRYNKTGSAHPARLLKQYGFVGVHMGVSIKSRHGPRSRWYLTPLGIKTLAELTK